MPKPSAKPVSRNALKLSPNILFDSLEEINKWIQTSYPGQDIKLLKTFPVTKIRCEIEIPHYHLHIPICGITNFLSFKTWKKAEEFIKIQLAGHIAIGEKWECKFCEGWHFYGTTDRTNSDGKFRTGIMTEPGGTIMRIPEDVRRIIDNSKV